MPRLAQTLVHLNNVIEPFLHPMVDLPINEVKQYHSQNFEEFLITEFLLSQHEPTVMQEYWEMHNITIEQMSLEDFSKQLNLFNSLHMLTNMFSM